MNARILTTATLFTAFAGVLTAQAADSQLLSLVMPDAKVLAGVNVDQAKASPFGLYVLTQMQSNGAAMQQLISLTGFDPTRDVHELLAATSAVPKGDKGLAVARGNFDLSKITAVASEHGALTEIYSGVTIIEDPKQLCGIAFLDSTLVIAGDVANVKAAIDRPQSGQALPASVINLVNQWSNSQDAWVITTVSPSSLQPLSAAPKLPGIGANAAGVFQQIQQAAAGVKFGNVVTIKAQAQADTAQNASSMSDALKMLVNLAQMQASQKEPQLAALVQGLTIAAQGNLLNVTLSLPQAQIQQLVNQSKKVVVSPAARKVVGK